MWLIYQNSSWEFDSFFSAKYENPWHNFESELLHWSYYITDAYSYDDITKNNNLQRPVALRKYFTSKLIKMLKSWCENAASWNQWHWQRMWAFGGVFFDRSHSQIFYDPNRYRFLHELSLGVFLTNNECILMFRNYTIFVIPPIYTASSNLFLQDHLKHMALLKCMHKGELTIQPFWYWPVWRWVRRDCGRDGSLASGGRSGKTSKTLVKIELFYYISQQKTDRPLSEFIC